MPASAGVPTTIVVGTDGSETAARALDRAVALAVALGAELHIVSAFNDRAPTGVAAAGVSIDSGWVVAAKTAGEKVVKEAEEKARSGGVKKAHRRGASG